jgi:photosystem II stability/assembly factor-like uncharacterized protein
VNGGKDWQTINTGLTGVVPNWLAVNPQDPAVVYAAVDSTGVFGSKNGGQSWERLTTSWRGPIMVDPANPQHVVVISGDQVLIADDGWHFTRTNTLPKPAGANLSIIGNTLIVRDQHWFLGVGYLDTSLPYMNQDGGGGLYQSSDGENWTRIDTQQTFYAIQALAFDPQDTHTIYAATWGGGDSGQGASILISRDDGLTWQQSNTGLDSESTTGSSSLAVEPVPPYRIFLGNAGSLFLSTDQGSSWSQVPGPSKLFGTTAFNAILFSPGIMPVLYAATTIGLFKSADGAKTWQRAQGSLGQFEIWSMAAVAASDRQILYVATVGGMSQPGLSPAALSADASDPLLGAGVYRNTTRVHYQKYFLPMISENP